MKRLILPIAIVAMTSTVASAQGRLVKGQVLDESGEGIPGASILVKGTSLGTVTDVDGNFNIQVPEDKNILVINSIGLESREIQAGNGANRLNISLKQGASNVLKETIITALNIKRSEKSLGYSAQQLKASDFENSRDANVINSIAGKVAGVRVNSQSGALGGTSKIVIRGSSSLSGSSQPLFVVDGVPISNSSMGASSQGVNVDYGNRVADINPDDIETWTVLKGPAATAQYGSLAKDGAIIITTKRGANNGELSISVNSSFRAEKVLRLPDLQSEYAQGNFGIYSLKNSNGWGPKISDMQNTPVKDFMGRTVTLKANPNNLENFFETGATYMNDVSLSGGDQKNDYRVSFGALDAKGIVTNQTLKRYNLSTNVGHKFNDKVSSRATFNYSNTRGAGRPVQSSNNTNVLTSSVYGIPVTVDVNDLKNNYQDEFGNQTFMTTDKDGNNPYWILNKNINTNTVDRFFGSLYLDYKPVSWLTIANNFGYDLYIENRSQVVRKGTAGNMNGAFYYVDINSKRFNNDLMAIFQKDITKDFNLKAMLGNNILDRQSGAKDLTGTGLQVDALYVPSNASTVTAGKSFTQSRLVSMYGELTGAYKDYLFLTVTGRNDWSSTLPIENRSYFYPSFSGSFVFTEVMQKNDILSFGKIRASWAQVGSDTDPYVLYQTYASSNSVFTQYLSQGNLLPHMGYSGFTGPRVLPNAGFKPQKANSFEIGTDLRFFKNRIGLDVTYYNTKTKDQILSIDVPLSTGYFAKLINAGQVTNKGIEVQFRAEPFKSSKGFNWEFMANLSHNRQTVDALYDDLEYYAVQSGWSGLQVKAPVGGSFALYGSGFKRAPDGSYIINAGTGLREIEADKYLGDINPTFMLGINNRFSYKGFSLGFLVDIRQGGVFYSGTVSSLRSTGMAVETLEGREGGFIDKGVNETKDANGNSVFTENTTSVQSMQDFWGRYSGTTEGNVFDASYVKLREMNISYALPAKYLPFNKVIKGLEIGFEGRNLWLIKSFVPHVDPESSYFGANSAGDGVEFNSFPSTKSYGVNLKVKL